MAAHDKHHSIPRFLLNSWQSSPDDLLSLFWWGHGGQFKHSRRSSKLVARYSGLYALQSDSDKNSLERDFFGNKIDTPGAAAYQAILRNGVKNLTDSQVEAWARFIAVLLLRSPHDIERARTQGREVVYQLLRDQPPGEVKGLPAGQTLLEYVQTHYSHLIDDVGLSSLPLIAQSAEFITKIQTAYWATMSPNSSTNSFLIGDKPVIYHGSMATEFVITLPLTPSLIFLAYSNENVAPGLATLSPDELVDLINRISIQQATKFVCSDNESHAGLIEMYLKRPI